MSVSSYRQIFSHSSIIFGLGLGLNFLSQIIITRNLGPFEYGKYYYVISWIFVLIVPVKFGFDHVIIRYYSKYVESNNNRSLRGLVIMSKNLVLLNSLIIILLASIIIYLNKEIFHGDLLYSFMIGFLCLPLLGLLYIRQAILRSAHFFISSLLSESIILPFLLITLVLISSFFKSELNSIDVLIFTLLVFVLVTLFGNYLEKLKLNNSEYIENPKYELKEWLNYGFILMLINGMHVLLNHIDTIIMIIYLDMNYIGIYGVASKCAILIALPLTIANIVSHPLFSNAIASQKPSEIQKILNHIMKIVTAISLLLLIIIFIFSQSLLNYFGEEFIEASSTLKILILGQFINSISGPVAVILTLLNKQKLVLKYMFLAVIISILLNLILIPSIGMIGAALATTIAIIFWNIALYLHLYFKDNINTLAWTLEYINKK